MNERINELIKQSYVTVRSQNDRDVTYFSQEKFAELIVKECLSVIEEMNPHDPERNIDDIFDEVDEHFGVEE